MTKRPSRNKPFRKSRLRKKKRSRDLLMESLEDRVLLAVGPQLIAIQPNQGGVLEDGDVRDIAPQQLTFIFNEGEAIDEATLASGIQIMRTGLDDVFGDADDVVVDPGFIGINPERPNEVFVRFAETLPDDLYRIEIFGTGATPLTNTLGEAFDCATDFSIDFDLDLGAQVVAVVPEPIMGAGTGNLTQNRNQILVYFNDDDLNAASATNEEFYQLIFTNDTATNTDDVVINPDSVAYNSDTDIATLTFSGDLHTLAPGMGTYRLRIGTDEVRPDAPTREQLAPTATTDFNTDGDVTIAFTAAVPVGSGDPVTIEITKSDLGGAPPTISVTGRTLNITLNSNGATPTTAQQLIDALAADAAALEIVRAEITAGIISTNIAAPSDDPTTFTLVDPGSAFVTAVDLGALSDRGQIITSAVEAQFFALDLPGSDDDPGHGGGHVGTVGDSDPGIVTVAYNFRRDYGIVSGEQQFNLITEVQKERVRETFQFLGDSLGVQFTETEEAGITVATGDMRAINPLLTSVDTGPGGLLGLSGVVMDPILGAVPTAILDNAEPWNDAFGISENVATPSYFQEAMRLAETLLGLGASGSLAQLTVTGGFQGAPEYGNTALAFDNRVEPTFPGDHDVLHGQYLHRPESKDIDLYKFTLTEPGLFTAETIAERQENSSLLDTVISVYQELGLNRELISRNDDYYSDDSFVELRLNPGTYYVAVTASGNTQFDPTIEDTGFGGTTEGKYDLRLNFRPQVLPDNAIVDETGTAFDGDADGSPDGVYSFWSQANNPANTIYVNKAHTPDGALPLGTLTNPYNNIDTAFTFASPGDIVRIVGNGGADGNLLTRGDNLAYEIGFDASQAIPVPLADGTTMNVPQGVMVQVDSGAIFKLRDARVSVGSSSPALQRNGSGLQVLGTPRNLTPGGSVIRDASGEIVPGSVFFTSFDDEDLGFDTNPLPTTPDPGNWGGIVFRNDLDNANGLFNWEDEAIFLNYVNHADIRYGGGFVVVDSVPRIVTPIQMTDARPTLSFNTITLSADAAMSANPDSFKEDNFHAPEFQETEYTSDYERVGPEIHGNLLLNNTINGLFINIPTEAGQSLERLTVSGRWDDTDIVHVVEENLIIDGSPGGPLAEPIFIPGGAPAVEPGVGATTGAVNPDSFTYEARLDGSLVIDPGSIVKIDGARIVTDISAQFLAEGLAGQEIVFTSLSDDKFGAGGTYDTSNDADGNAPTAGDWGGFYFGHLSRASIDQALITFAGGVTRVEGQFAGFNAVEVHQAYARIANSTFELNANGTNDVAVVDNRVGRGFNAPGTIFARGAQPVIVNNTLQNNDGPAINIDANALNYRIVTDMGRNTRFIGLATDQTGFEFGGDNQGPLVRGNLLDFNLDDTEIQQFFDVDPGAVDDIRQINGMQVRGATLTTETVWDDTDIVHVLTETIYIPDFHTFTGLSLESNAAESLVVKLLNDPDNPNGAMAGFTATGLPLGIDDRIGGRIHVLGQPGKPVILTSLHDDTVGAGLKPDLSPNTDTGGDGADGISGPGDWRSVRIEAFSHDRNVEVVTEQEAPAEVAPGSNATPATAQFLGLLAPFEKGGDEILRLGFEIKGYLNEANDVDVYSFDARAGTEVWIDIDRTTHALDPVVELVDANGLVIARSDDSLREKEDQEDLFDRGGAVTVNILDKDPLVSFDRYTTNPRDAGFRMLLPGAPDKLNTYHVRVRSGSRILLEETPDLDANVLGGKTTGVYQLQIRLQEADEIAGSTVQFADIRYATDGIEVLGQVIHSPLLGEVAEATGLANETFANAQPIGSVGSTDRGALSVSGDLSTAADVDWYQATISGPVIFDFDYTDGFARPDTLIYIFDSTGRLVLFNDNSGVNDDLPAALLGADVTDLSRGSAGIFDPLIGPIDLPAGTYNIAVTNVVNVPAELGNSRIRLEPSDSIGRIVEDHIVNPPALLNPIPTLPPIAPGISTFEPAQTPKALDGGSVVPFHLGDVVLFVSQEFPPDIPNTPDNSRLVMIDPFTGTLEAVPGQYQFNVGDIAIRNNGELFGFSLDLNDVNGPSDEESGNIIRVNTGTGRAENLGDDNIKTFEEDVDDNGVPNDTPIRSNLLDGQRVGVGQQFQAIAFGRPGLVASERLLAVGVRSDADRPPPGVDFPENAIYQFGTEEGVDLGEAFPNPGDAKFEDAGTDTTAIGEVLTSSVIRVIERQYGPTEFDDSATFLRFNDDGELIDTISSFVDGQTFTVDDTVKTTTFEFNTGPEVRLNVNLNTGLIVRDGQFFILDQDPTDDVVGDIFQFDTGPAIEITANSGLTMPDGTVVTVQDTMGGTASFEYDSDDPNADPPIPPEDPNATLIPIGPGTTGVQLAGLLADAINNSDLDAEAFAVGRTVTLTGDFTIDVSQPGAPPAPLAGLRLDGARGIAPVIQAVDGSQIDDGDTFFVTTNADLTAFEFESGYLFEVPEAGGVSIGTNETFNVVNATTLADVTFEFTRGGGLTVGDVEIDISGDPTQNALANLIESAINVTPGLGLTTSNLGDGRLQVGGTAGVHTVTNASSLALIGEPGLTDPTAVQIDYTPGATQTAAQIANLIEGAIDAATADPLNPLQADADANGDLVVINGPAITFDPVSTLLTELPIAGVIQTEEAITISDEELMMGVTQATILAGDIVQEVNLHPDYTASADGVRLNFIRTAGGILEGDFSGVQVMADQGSSGAVSPGSVPIDFLAADTAADIATKISDAINGALDPFVTSIVTGTTVRLDGGTATESIVPIQAQGEGPGGVVTGMAILPNGRTFAVSDAGGLYELTFDLIGPDYSVSTTYVRSSADDLLVADGGNPIQFAGLTEGPPNVEGGRYRNMLFGISNDGDLYAFDTSGVLQPIFVDGQTSLNLGIVAGAGSQIQGLDFSTLDGNLWNITPDSSPTNAQRQNDTDHQLLVPVTGSRDAPGFNGGSTFHFGRGNGGNFDFPGGAHGTIVSNEFSLEGYSADDAPTLYFTYFLDTERSNGPAPVRDSFRVFVSDDGGDWQIVAGNSGGGAGLTDDASWRQASIGLAGFAGSKNLRLRFDFSSAGSMNVGDITTTGEELRTVAAELLRDGDTFTIDGTDTYEFDLGISVTPPTRGIVPDGETLSVENEAGAVTTYEFDNDGTVRSGIVVPDGQFVPDGGTFGVTVGGTTESFELESGLRLAAPDEGGFPGGVTDGETFTITSGGSTVTFEFDGDGDFVDVAPADGIPDNVLIPIDATTTQDELVDLIVAAVGAEFATLALVPFNAGNGIVQLGGTAQTLDATGAPSLTASGAAGLATAGTPVVFDPSLTGPEIATLVADAINAEFGVGTASTDGRQVLLADTTATFDAETSPLVEQTNVPVLISLTQTASDLSQLLTAAIVANGPAGVTPVRATIFEANGPDGTTHPTNNTFEMTARISLEGAASVTQVAAPGEANAVVPLEGDFGVLPGNILVPITVNMTRAQVGSAVDTVLESNYGSTSIVATDGFEFDDADTFQITDATTTAVFEFDTGYVLNVPALGAGPGGVVDGDLFHLSNGVSSLFEYDIDGVVNELLLVTDIADIAVGDTIDIRDITLPDPVVFEFVDGGPPLTPGALAVDLAGLTTNAEVAAELRDVIDISPLAADGLVARTTGVADDLVHLQGFEVDIFSATLGVDTQASDPIVIEPDATQVQIAAETFGVLDASLDAGPLGLTPAVLNSGRVHIGGNDDVELLIDAANLTSSGTPGVVPGREAVEIVPSLSFNPAQVAAEIQAAIDASPLAGSLTTTLNGRRVVLVGDDIVFTTANSPLTLEVATNIVKDDDDLLRIIGHNVTDQGPLGFDNVLPGDAIGAFTASRLATVANNPNPGALRGMDNVHEGVYIDDLIIGFAERGQMVTSANVNTAFNSLPIPPGIIVDGPYEFEIRPASSYGVRLSATALDISGMSGPAFTYDTNDRLDDRISLVAPFGHDLADGQQFTLGDGIDEVTFEFVDITPISLTEANDTLLEAIDSGIDAGDLTTFRAIGEIGDNMDLPTFDDVDLVRLDLAAGQRFSVDVDTDPAGTLDAALRLFDAAGNELDFSDNDAGADEVPSLDPFLETIAPSAGTFFIGISSSPNLFYDPAVAGSGFGGSVGAYELEIRIGTEGGLGPNIIPFSSADTDFEIARRIVDAVNGDIPQETLDITASTADGAFLSQDMSTSNRVNLHGAVVRVGTLDTRLLQESNDTIAEAVPAGLMPGVPGAYAGDGFIGDNPNLSVEHELDVDFVSLDLTAGDVLTISFDAFRTDPSLTPVVNIFDAAGTLLAPAATGFVVTTDGTYFFGISSADNSFTLEGGVPVSTYDPTLEGSGTFTTMLSDGHYRLLINVGPGTIPFQEFQLNGDANRFRDQGQLILNSNTISNSQNFGIVADAGARTGPSGANSHLGSARLTREVNSDSLVPGVTIVNNIIYGSGEGGIHFSGDPNPADQSPAAVPYGRIVNNTLYGDGGRLGGGMNNDIGILVDENASPTLLNNIVANFATAVEVDMTSSSTVIGGLLVKGNADVPEVVADPSTLDLGELLIVLADADPLFANPDTGNFSLAPFSLAIDSSVDSIEDRFELTTVKNPIGIPVSPILAPDEDALGQLRVDDPNVDTPAGVGENVFVDRGAIDRVDFEGLVAALIAPFDNDAQGIDLNPAETIVQIADGILSQFIILLTDTGVGVDDASVTADKVTITRDGVPLVLDTDYRFDYDATSDQILLTPQAGIWLPNFTYVITLDNTEGTGVRDLAGNAVKPNQTTPPFDTKFTIEIGGALDFGDAPDPFFPTLEVNDGARHSIVPGLFLGGGVDAEIDGQPSASASGDGTDEDGVTLDTALLPGTDATVTIVASADGFIDAWLDFNVDTDWDDAGEQIFVSQAVVAGPNELTFAVPADAGVGATFARFRYSTDGGLATTGAAADGEVEDYQFNLPDPSRPWQNPLNRLDVNGDGSVSPIDALIVINELDVPKIRDVQTGELPANPTPAPPPPFLDVNGDGFVSPIDALIIINFLNAASPAFGGVSVDAGVGVAAATSPAPAPAPVSAAPVTAAPAVVTSAIAASVSPAPAPVNDVAALRTPAAASPVATPVRAAAATPVTAAASYSEPILVLPEAELPLASSAAAADVAPTPVESDERSLHEEALRDDGLLEEIALEVGGTERDEDARDVLFARLG